MSKLVKFVITLFGLIVFVAGMYLFVCKNTVINVIGGDVSIEIGQGYKDLGYEVVLLGKKTGIEAECEGNVETEKIGTYELKYSLKWNRWCTAKKIVEIRPTAEMIASGGTYINGIILVNKDNPVNPDYSPGENPEAKAALKELQKAAAKDGYDLPKVDGFRSYKTQKKLHEFWIDTIGTEAADRYSAKPGHSEHQTGLAFDVGLADPIFAKWPEAKWLAENAHKFGFIIRYSKGKEEITGYAYEPWHIRYLGKEIAEEIYAKNLTLEEYLGVK